MAHIAGSIVIDRPVPEVFAFVTDSRNEPGYNRAMREVRLLTGEPIGVGTQFVASMGRGGLTMHVTLTEHDPPHRVGSRTSSRLLETTGRLEFVPTTVDGTEATRMSWDWQVTPKGWLRLLGPGFAPVAARLERRTWTAAKAALEGG